MKSFNIKFLRNFLVVGMLLFSASFVRGEGTIGGAIEMSGKALSKNQIEKALQLSSQGIEDFGDNVLIHGSKIGVLYYIKGSSEMRLRQFEAALESFTTCYEQFPNDAAANTNANRFHKKALLRRAEVLQQLEDYEEAVKMYKKFIAERVESNRSDRYNRGKFYINLAICYLKIPEVDFVRGIENFEIALANQASYGITSNQIMRAFQVLLEATIEAGVDKEQVLIDFLAANGSNVRLAPSKAFAYAPLYLNLANRAIKKKLYRVALEVYSHVPDTQIAKDDVEARIAAIAPRSQVVDRNEEHSISNLNEILDRINNKISQSDTYDSIALQAIGSLHLTLGNKRGAYVAFKQLEKFHNKSKNRESNLYRLTLLNASFGDAKDSDENGGKFLRLFPNSEHAPVVLRQMLSSLFANREYEKCIEIAKRVEPTLPEGSPQHDTCLYVLAGSHFYLGLFDEAQQHLDRHVNQYPESQQRMNALFFQVANTARRQRYSEASSLFKGFLQSYPDASENPFMANALSDLASVQLAQDQLDEALENCKKVVEEFPSSQVVESTYLLMGDIYQYQESFDDAETFYKKALEIGVERANNAVAGEALSSLVSLLASQTGEGSTLDRRKDAIQYYDQFFADYAEGSTFLSQTANAGYPVLKVNGRTKDGLETLQNVINILAERPDSPELEETINSYLEYYSEEHGRDATRKHFFDDFSFRKESSKALLRTAMISIEEDALIAARKKQDQPKILASEAAIKALFADIKSFKLESLSDYTLIKVGDFIRTKTQSPNEARSYYKTIIAKRNNKFRLQAMFGLADLLANTGNSVDSNEAVKILNEVINTPQNAKDREKAYFRLISIQRELRRWNDVIALGSEYSIPDKVGAKKTRRGTKRFTKNASRVQLFVAQAMEEKGDLASALITYSNAATAGRSNLQVAVPAYLSWADIIWYGKVSDASDKQNAYDVLERYARGMERNIDRIEKNPTDLKFFRKLQARVKIYEDSGKIITYAQQLAEKQK